MDILQNLDQVLKFCESIGLGGMAKKSRFARYRKCIAHLIEIIRMGTLQREVGEHLLHPYLVSLVESVEFSSLLPYLCHCDPTAVYPKIKACLRGNFLPDDENLTSNQARNIQFELLLASMFSQVGLQPLLEEPDLKCKVDDTQVFFACKRLFATSTAALINLLSKAGEQLNKHVDLCQGVGVVAISLSRVFNPTQEALLSQSKRHGREALASWLDNLTMNIDIRDELRKLSERHVAAVLFCITSPFEDIQADRFTIGRYIKGETLVWEGCSNYNAVLKLEQAIMAMQY